MTTTSDICAIVTTYRPGSHLLATVEQLVSQVGRIIIVDDSGSPEIESEMRYQLSSCKTVIVLHNEKNVGLAASLNKGIKEAGDRGYSWIITLDDDSIVKQDFSSTLIESWAIISRQCPLGILALSRRAESIRIKPDKFAWKTKRMVITSGSYFPMETFDKVGRFREEFVIDSIDVDYCFRTRAVGLQVILVEKQGMDHRLGTPRLAHLGPISIVLAEHSPLRTYYRVRNSFALLTECWKTEPFYIAGVTYCNLQQLLAIAFFYRNKRAHMAAMLGGFHHAWKRRFGFCEKIYE